MPYDILETTKNKAITDTCLEKGEKLLSLWDKLEDFFQRKVDLLTQKSLKNPFLLENIDKTKILLYDNERKEVFV